MFRQSLETMVYGTLTYFRVGRKVIDKSVIVLVESFEWNLLNTVGANLTV